MDNLKQPVMQFPCASDVKQMITDEMILLAGQLLYAKAKVQTIKPIVQGYQRRILEKNQWTNAETTRRFKRPEKVILDPKHTYMLSDADFANYMIQVKIEQKLAGLLTESEDHCPLLVAEDVERKARRAFVDSMKIITKMDTDTVLRSHNGIRNLLKLEELNLKLLSSLGLLDGLININ